MKAGCFFSSFFAVLITLQLSPLPASAQAFKSSFDVDWGYYHPISASNPDMNPDFQTSMDVASPSDSNVSSIKTRDPKTSEVPSREPINISNEPKGSLKRLPIPRIKPLKASKPVYLKPPALDLDFRDMAIEAGVWVPSSVVPMGLATNTGTPSNSIIKSLSSNGSKAVGEVHYFTGSLTDRAFKWSQGTNPILMPSNGGTAISSESFAYDISEDGTKASIKPKFIQNWPFPSPAQCAPNTPRYGRAAHFWDLNSALVTGISLLGDLLPLDNCLNDSYTSYGLGMKLVGSSYKIVGFGTPGTQARAMIVTQGGVPIAATQGFNGLFEELTDLNVFGTFAVGDQLDNSFASYSAFRLNLSTSTKLMLPIPTNPTGLTSCRTTRMTQNMSNGVMYVAGYCNPAPPYDTGEASRAVYWTIYSPTNIQVTVLPFPQGADPNFIGSRAYDITLSQGIIKIVGEYFNFFGGDNSRALYYSSNGGAQFLSDALQIPEVPGNPSTSPIFIRAQAISTDGTSVGGLHVAAGNSSELKDGFIATFGHFEKLSTIDTYFLADGYKP